MDISQDKTVKKRVPLTLSMVINIYDTCNTSLCPILLMSKKLDLCRLCTHKSKLDTTKITFTIIRIKERSIRKIIAFMTILLFYLIDLVF